jgi:hypothetical protein
MASGEEIIDYQRRKLTSFSGNILESLKKNDLNNSKLILSELLSYLEQIPSEIIYQSANIHLTFIYFISAIFGVDRNLFGSALNISLKYFSDSIQLKEIMAKKLFLENKFKESLNLWLQIESRLNEETYYPYFSFPKRETMLNCLKVIRLCYEKLGDTEQKLIYNDKLNYYIIIHNLRFEVSTFLFKY